MKLFPAYDLIRVINLRARTDRKAEMTAELKRVGLAQDSRVKFFEAMTSDTAAPWRAKGERGVFLSHLAVLREAASKNANLLILEDDCDFTDALPAARQDDGIAIYYGGYDAADPTDLKASDIIGSHCMGFSADTVRALVPFLEALFDHESPPPIDGAYVWFRRANPDMATQFAVPVIAVQRPSRSDIAQQRLFDRLPIARDIAGQARKGKRALQRGEVTFGLPEAVVLAIVGTAIAVISVAWRLAPGSQPFP